ncbi:MAG TPA: hypothetical protein P5528_07270 [Steroidobacteraceae bacterium]|nr:hypothetical protein [Steroidobacteraceae bacterium]HRX89232.1 hypothetical protein [Steroidobacteraceae bacterium]
MADDLEQQLAAATAALAELQGFTHVTTETAARIAVGATHAVRAVRAAVVASQFDIEPAHFQLELERLADSDADPGK